MAQRKRDDSIYGSEPEQKNPMAGKKVTFVEDENDKENADGVRGHLVEIGVNDAKTKLYDRYLKRVMDIVLSFGGLIVLAPVYAGISLAIVIDDPGLVLFSQKRVGKNKEYFKLHKFRTMRMSTPPDVPTHMLANPEQYITRVGKFLRKYSLDELPQIWDIFIGNMSVIGPRPALWNQDVLVAERDKYGANDVKPGLTGWAQINGRDELEIPIKAKLDGEYVEKESLLFDAKCFFGTIFSVLRHDGVVEGGTGEMKKTIDAASNDNIGKIGFEEPVKVDFFAHKKVLITGAGSYIGESFRKYAAGHYGENFEIDVIDMIDGTWRNHDFSSYDSVYHVAGIAHADVGNVSEKTKKKYYEVNTDLAIETAQKAKNAGVKQFVFMSSMIIYGESAGYGKKRKIDRNTHPAPANFYGDSKWQADKGVRALADEQFHVAVLRPPMIYGNGSKGNYQTLSKLARKLPVFPNVDNERSMLHIDNLCEFLCQLMLLGEGGVFIPQNGEYTNTADMVREIAKASGKKNIQTRLLNPMVWLGSKIPGKIGGLVNKAFGSMTYAQELSEYPGVDYRVVDFRESIRRTEGKTKDSVEKSSKKKKHILVVSQYFYPETFRINDICQEWIKRGYKVTVITGIPNYPMGKFFDGYGYTKKRRETWNGIEVIRIPIIARGKNSIGMVTNYLSFVISGFVKNLFVDIKADFVFTFEVSPMTQALLGCWYAKKHHVPHYLYVQDLWPENVEVVTGITTSFVIKPIDKMVNYIYKNTDEIFVTSPSFVEAICNRKVKVDKNKVHYWPQYAEEFYVPIKNPSVHEIPTDDSFKIIFTGNIGTAQGLQILPEAAEFLRDENLKFVMVGDGRYLDEFNREIARRNVTDKFLMIPRQSAERIPEFLAMCDAAFLSFQDNALWRKTIPAKLQSYMACGMPVIASASGETKRIIEKAQCGICCKIGDAEKLAEGIRTIKNADLDGMGTNSRTYFEKHFDKQKLMDEMDLYFKE